MKYLLLLFLLPNICFAIDPNDIITLTNKEREAVHLTPLKSNKKLSMAAERKGVDMTGRGYFGHYFKGTTPWWFIKKVGYKYCYAGENLAVGFDSAESAVKALMASPTHKDNMLGRYTDIGVAVVSGFRGKYEQEFIILMFGQVCL